MRLVVLPLLWLLTYAFVQAPPTWVAAPTSDLLTTESSELKAPLTLNSAARLAAEVSAKVVTAQADLAAAEREAARAEGDPLSLRLPRLEAQHKLENAQSALANARLAARGDALSAFFAALEADDTLSLSEHAKRIANTSLEAKQIQAAAGAATKLELERAKNALAAAQRETQAARQSRGLAYLEFANILGQRAAGLQLQAVSTVPRLPSWNEVKTKVDLNQQLTGAQHAVAVAELQLLSSDNALSARAEIEVNRDQLETAKMLLRETKRGLELSLKQHYSILQAAQTSLENAQASLATSKTNLAAQELRYEAGSISLIDLENVKREHASSQASVNAARHALHRALVTFELSVQDGSGTEGGAGAVGD